MMTKHKTTMAERLNIGDEARELKLGCTFNSKNTTAFHTIKYDFKPASVDINRVATVDVGSSSQVTVTVPNLVNSGVPHTVYKGNHRKYTKECLIIFDKKTGDMTLEKLHHNIQVKKTRSENTSKNNPLPMMKLENSTMRVSSKTKVSTGSRKNNIIDFKPRNSPMQQNSPSRPIQKSPQSAPAWNANNTQATLPSIPMIFDDDDSNTAGQNGNSSSTLAGSGHTLSNEFHVPQQSTSYAKQSKQHNSTMQQKQIKQQKQQPQQTSLSNLPTQQINQLPQNSSHQAQQQQQQQQQFSALTNNRTFQKDNGGVVASRNNYICAKSTNSNKSPSPTQVSLPNMKALIDQEVGVLSSSDSSSDSDSSASDSASDSDESKDNTQEHHSFPDVVQGASTTGPNLNTQQTSDYSKIGFSNDLLHDDLQLSESNTSETSDED